MKLINASNQKGEKNRRYFESLKQKRVMKIKTKLKTYEVNNNVNCINYEGTCLRGKLPHTAGDKRLQMIDRNFLSRLPTQSTNHLDLNMEKYSLKIKQRATTTKKLIKLYHHN